MTTADQHVYDSGAAQMAAGLTTILEQTEHLPEALAARTLTSFINIRLGGARRDTERFALCAMLVRLDRAQRTAAAVHTSAPVTSPPAGPPVSRWLVVLVLMTLVGCAIGGAFLLADFHGFWQTVIPLFVAMVGEVLATVWLLNRIRTGGGR